MTAQDITAQDRPLPPPYKRVTQEQYGTISYGITCALEGENEIFPHALLLHWCDDDETQTTYALWVDSVPGHIFLGITAIYWREIYRPQYTQGQAIIPYIQAHTSFYPRTELYAHADLIGFTRSIARRMPLPESWPYSRMPRNVAALIERATVKYLTLGYK